MGHELKYKELSEQKQQLDKKLRSMLEEADRQFMYYKKDQDQKIKKLVNETKQLQKQLEEILKKNQEYKEIITENQFKEASQVRSKMETKIKNLEEELNQTKEENKNLLIKTEQLEKKSEMATADPLLQQKNEENIQLPDRSTLELKIRELELKLEQQLTVNDMSLKDIIRVKKKNEDCELEIQALKAREISMTDNYLAQIKMFQERQKNEQRKRQERQSSEETNNNNELKLQLKSLESELKQVKKQKESQQQQIFNLEGILAESRLSENSERASLIPEPFTCGKLPWEQDSESGNKGKIKKKGNYWTQKVDASSNENTNA